MAICSKVLTGTIFKPHFLKMAKMQIALCCTKPSKLTFLLLSKFLSRPVRSTSTLRLPPSTPRTVETPDYTVVMAVAGDGISLSTEQNAATRKRSKAQFTWLIIRGLICIVTAQSKVSVQPIYVVVQSASLQILYMYIIFYEIYKFIYHVNML